MLHPFTLEQIGARMSVSHEQKQYWRANVRFVTILLASWFVIGYGCSIFFIEQMNAIKIGSVGLGFWFAQQGSIFFFVLLVLAYALRMDQLDRQHGVEE